MKLGNNEHEQPATPGPPYRLAAIIIISMLLLALVIELGVPQT